MLALADGKVVGRLVHDDDAVLEFDRAADFHRLPLATREPLDLIIGGNVIAQTKFADHLCRHLAHGFEIEDRDAEEAPHRLAPKVEIARNRKVVTKTHRLLDRLDPLVNGEFRVEFFDPFAIEPDLARGRLVNAAKHPDQRGLAGAIVTDQPDQLARVEIDRDVFQRVKGPEIELQVLDLDQRSSSHRKVLSRQTECPARRASDWLKITATIRTTPTKVMNHEDGAPSAISS